MPSTAACRPAATAIRGAARRWLAFEGHRKSIHGKFLSVHVKPEFVQGKFLSVQGKPEFVQRKFLFIHGKPKFVQRKSLSVQGKPESVQEKFLPVHEKRKSIQGKFFPVHGKRKFVHGKFLSVHEKSRAVRRLIPPLVRRHPDRRFKIATRGRDGNPQRLRRDPASTDRSLRPDASFPAFGHRASTRTAI
jgi:hypothetical protein